MDIGTCRTILVERADYVEPKADQAQVEPDFMRYIKNMNINYVNHGYLEDHFAEEDNQNVLNAALNNPATSEPV